MGKMAAILDDCERTARVALPTAATSGFISGEVGISAALDAFKPRHCCLYNSAVASTAVVREYISKREVCVP